MSASTSQQELKKKKKKKPKSNLPTSGLTDDIGKDLLALEFDKELASMKKEMKGPYLDKNQNKSLKQAQRQARKQSELEDKHLSSSANTNSMQKI